MATLNQRSKFLNSTPIPDEDEYSGLFDESTDLFDEKAPAAPISRVPNSKFNSLYQPYDAPVSMDEYFNPGKEFKGDKRPRWYEDFPKQYSGDGSDLNIPETYSDVIPDDEFEETELIIPDDEIDMVFAPQKPRPDVKMNPKNVGKMKELFGDDVTFASPSDDRKAKTEAALKKYPTPEEKRKADTEKALKKYPKAGDKNKPLGKF